MGNPVVHFEIRSADPDAARSFYGPLFGWTFPDGGMPGYTYVDTGVEGAVPGGISPPQGGEPLVTFFVGVQDVTATLEAVARGGRIVQPRRRCRGLPSASWRTRRGRWSGWRRPTPEASRLTDARGGSPEPSRLTGTGGVDNG